MRLLTALTLLQLAACGTWAGTDALPSSGSEQGDLRSDAAGPSLGLPVETMADVSAINDGFSASAACPWGFIHPGVDFVPSPPIGSRMPVVAAASGKVVFADAGLNGALWRVNVGLAHEPDFLTEYVFETFSSSSDDRDAQLAEVLVTLGQTVGRGQRIGRLVAAAPGAHVHFGMNIADVKSCPAPYFIPKVRSEILAKLRETFPGAQLCYP